MNDLEIEKEIQRLKLTAPRVTPERLAEKIAKAEYYTFPGSCLTVCVITTQNGFHVLGESACASPENFNEQLGRDIAFQKAKDKLWPLEGYLLKEELHTRTKLVSNG